MVLTVTEDTPADMLAGNMELLVQLPPRSDDDFDNTDDSYDGDEDDIRHQHLRNLHRHHNHHHNNGHHPRRSANGNARKVTVARSTPMMDLLVQVATLQKLSASSYTLEAIGEHGLVLTHHPNTPIGALDALQVKLLPKQGTFAPMKKRHANQPFETTFRLQVHLPRNQLYVSRVSSRMNLGKILEEVCREKNLDRNNYELRHPANIEETLDTSLSLQDYHLQEVTLCPKRRSLGSSLSSQDIMALQRQEERRRQEAKQSVFGFAFKKSKESSLSTDSLGERSVSPARSDGTGRSASPQAPTAPTRPQRKRRPAPKPPMPKAQSGPNAGPDVNKLPEVERENADRVMVISHSRNSSDSSGYHEASVLSDNLDSSIRVPETLPRRSKLQLQPSELPAGRTLAETSETSKSLGNLAAVTHVRPTIARGISNSSLMSAGLRKKKAAPAPPQPRPLSSAISIQALERIVDSEESLNSAHHVESLPEKASSDVAVSSKPEPIISHLNIDNNHDIPKQKTRDEEPREIERNDPIIPAPKIAETVAIIPNVEPASHRKRARVVLPVPKPRGPTARLEHAAQSVHHPLQSVVPNIVDHLESTTRSFSGNKNILDRGVDEVDYRDHRKNVSVSPRPTPRHRIEETSPTVRQALQDSDTDGHDKSDYEAQSKGSQVPKKPKRRILESLEYYETTQKVFEAKPTAEPSKYPPKIKSSGKENGVEAIKLKPVAPYRSGKNNPTAQLTSSRSCAVISTIPKCDNFQRSASVATEDSGSCSDDERSASTVSSRVDSSLGFSFESEKSSLSNGSQQKRKTERNDRITSSHATIRENNSSSIEDELTLEDFGMFERSKRIPNWSSNLLRSNSVLNNFEINTFEGRGRHLTSRSEDYAFALNPNLARNVSDLSADVYPDKYAKKQSNPIARTASGKSVKQSRPMNVLPAFLTSGITGWDQNESLKSVKMDHRRTDGTLGETDSPKPLITNTDSTSNLLKKVSDTLSDSLQSSTVSVAPSSLANELPSSPKSAKVVLRHKVNEAHPSAEVSKNLELNVTKVENQTAKTHPATISSLDSLSGHQPVIVRNQTTSNIIQTPHTPPEWHYQLPEPPTAFRDSETSPPTRSSEMFTVSQSTSLKVDPAVTEDVAKYTKTNSESKRIEATVARPSTVEDGRNVRSLKVGELTIERGKLSRTGGKGVVETDSRRSSAASSTPSVAPVDNTLSNFVITTYSRPKKVNIFDEIERRDLETTISNSKNSPATVIANGSLRTGSLSTSDQPNSDSRKNSMSSQKSEKAIPEVTTREKSGNFNGEVDKTLSTSNIKISIATKPRPRSEIFSSDSQWTKPELHTDVDDSSRRISDQGARESVLGGNEKFSQWRENILKKQETPSKERQLQSLQVLRSILPQIENTQQQSDNNSETEKGNANPPEEIRISPAPSVTSDPVPEPIPQPPPPASSSEPQVKRYTYAGPPAIDLGSWSDRSRTTRVQIKPDSDYKFEKSKSPDGTPSPSKEIVNTVSRTHSSAELLHHSAPRPAPCTDQTTTLPRPNTQVNSFSMRQEPESTLDSRNRKEHNDLTKTLIARTTATGFKRPVSIAISSTNDVPVTISTSQSKNENEAGLGKDEVDTRPISFSALKQTFAKDQGHSQIKPNFTGYGRRPDSNCVRNEINGESENAQTNGYVTLRKEAHHLSNGTGGPQENRNFVSKTPTTRGQSFQDSVGFAKRTTRGNPMPVVKGFKVQVATNEEEPKRPAPACRIAISDISNSNHIPPHNGLRKTIVQVNGNDWSHTVPKPPPTMPIITGVTLKSASNRPRPKSTIIESADPRNSLLESIRSFGGAEQLRRTPRRNTNIGPGLGSRSVRS